MINKILIVSDLDMKRYDSFIEFQYGFLKECLRRNIKVKYVLPKEPCDLVKEKLKEVLFEYTVINKWWNQKDPCKRNNISVSFHILKVILKEKFDLVAFNFADESTVGIIAIVLRLMGRKVKLVWHQHSEINDIISGLSVRRHVNKLRILSWAIDLICPVFKKQEDVLIRRGIAKNKIATLYKGINLRRFSENLGSKGLFEQLKLKKTEKIVITVASLIERKGIEYFLKAASIVLKINHETQFLIVGDGPLRRHLEDFSRQLSIEHKVHFLGSRNDVHAILSISDIFVLPSLSEALCIAIIEASAAGKPIVATKVAGNPEVVEEGVNGFLVAPRDSTALADAISQLLNNEPLVKNMGEEGKKIALRKFSIEKMINNYLNVYCKLLGKIGD
jgi:glycosyltransferase involved in cell wall biosynthesis